MSVYYLNLDSEESRMRINRVPLVLQLPEELLQTLSTRFKERRLMKKISQEDLARKSGVGISKIRRLEQNGNIQLLDLIKLLDAIGEIDEIHRFMDFSQKIRNEREVDMLLKFQEKRPKRVRKPAFTYRTNNIKTESWAKNDK